MTEGNTERLEAALHGKYGIKLKLGEGGMASVYLAEDIKHRRNAALEILRPELAAVIGSEGPFGGGRHVCLGQHTAFPIMIMGTAHSSQRFDWRFMNPWVPPTGLAPLKPGCEFIAHIRRRR